MKDRPATPKEFQLRTWRVDRTSVASFLLRSPKRASKQLTSSAEAPQLQLAVLSPTNLYPSSPTTMQNTASSSPVLLTRNTDTQSPLFPRPRISLSPSPGPTEPTDGEESPWVNTIGRIAPGKSGRVIERLQSETDRLRRDLKVEELRRQEIEKRETLNKGTVEALRAENANLQQAKEVDAVVLRRRDRMLEDLKANLAIERTRRIRAEDATNEALRQVEEVRASTTREKNEARETTKHAVGHAEVLEQSHKQLSVEYRQRAKTFGTELKKLVDEHEEEIRKAKKLDETVLQLNVEVEKANKINSRLVEDFNTYRNESQKEFQKLQQIREEENAQNENTRAEAERIMGEARYLMNLHKGAMSRDQDTSPMSLS